jgi:DNA-binding MarR family transcriptional regulator
MAEPRWLDDDEQRTWRAFFGATQLFFDKLDRQLQRDAGIPHAYYEILVWLSESPDRSLRMSELARRTRSSPSRLSHAVARLAERGWLIRRDCATDKRGQIAFLTDDGVTALTAAAPGHVNEVRANLFDQLTPDQIRDLRTISEALLAGLAGSAPDAKFVTDPAPDSPGRPAS